jgi:hypothetical protein
MNYPILQGVHRIAGVIDEGCTPIKGFAIANRVGNFPKKGKLQGEGAR